MKKPQFKKRYVLGIGYPWALGLNDHVLIRMNQENTGQSPQILKWPKELWHKELPKYRLVLERVSHNG